MLRWMERPVQGASGAWAASLGPACRRQGSAKGLHGGLRSAVL